MEISRVLERIKKSLKAKKPFVVFALPDSNEATIFFQKEGIQFNNNEVDESCFVMNPFQGNEKAFHIPSKASEIIQFSVKNNPEKFKPVNVSTSKIEKEQHTTLITNAITKIKNNKASKIVVSRDKEITLSNFDIKTLFQRIFTLSHSTFRYLWYHPETAIWCGSTPELLLKTDDTCFHTMALAATRDYNKDNRKVHWNEKEINEHQLVVDDITTKLQKAVSVLKLSKTSTHRAGSVVHLKTDIKGCFKKGKASVVTIANLLHPTPAVCGTPLKSASNFIMNNEHYSREFYTGYLGYLNPKNKDSFLYVNLRCMKIENNTAHIYVGGGITADSIPIEEWEETQKKLQTMLQVLRPML